jgi:N-dimethylarginine dimethylaminohydrolase
MNTFNRTMLMSDAQHFSTKQQINPYYSDDSLNNAGAIREHEAIAAMFKAAGITVIRVPSPVHSQDGVYTANWALVRGDTAILARLPNVRKAEEAHAEKILTDLGKKVIKVPESYRFSGQGDALPYGDYLFCGTGYRADIEAQEFAAKQLGYTRIQLQTIPELDSKNRPVVNKVSGWPDSFFYDIDLALSIIRPPEGSEKGLIAYCPEAFTPESQVFLAKFDAAEKIEISLEEATVGFAGNLVSTGETVIMSDKAPKLAAALKKRGLKIMTPHIKELVKGGGYIRCTSLSFN